MDDSTTIGDDPGGDRRTDAAPLLASGSRIARRYTIGTRLGAGGFGEVYRAEDETLRRTIALKLLRPEALAAAHDPTFERFLAEARIVARLDHPHIVPVYDAGVHEGRPWIAMKIVEGVSVSQLVATEGPVDPARAIEILLQVADALSHAHRRGVLHLDVKPSNIVVERFEKGGEHAWLVDFGVARVVSGDSTWNRRTIAGTPGYLAPERILGKPTDGRSDLFSLACVALEMISGERAFDGRDFSEVATRIVAGAPNGTAMLRRRAGVRLARAVETALAKSPEDRQSDVRTFAESLKANHRSRATELREAIRRWRRDTPWDGRTPLAVDGLCKRFSTRTRVLDNLSIEVARGATYAVLGRNGTGKTTLIRTFLGMYRPDRGHVRMFGRDPRRERTGVMSRVGHVPTQLPAYEGLKVGEFLRFVSRSRGAWDESYSLHLLSKFGLPLDARIRDLSHGMRTKVSLLTALSHRPEFLVLDDPTVGLDVVAISEFFETLREISRREGTTIFIATHNVVEVEPIATHVGFLAEGRIVVSGSLKDILEGSASMRASFPDDVPEQLADVGLTNPVVSGRHVTGVATSDARGTAEKLRARGAVQIESRPLTLRELFVAMTK